MNFWFWPKMTFISSTISKKCTNYMRKPQNERFNGGYVKTLSLFLSLSFSLSLSPPTPTAPSPSFMLSLHLSHFFLMANSYALLFCHAMQWCRVKMQDGSILSWTTHDRNITWKESGRKAAIWAKFNTTSKGQSKPQLVSADHWMKSKTLKRYFCFLFIIAQ